MDSRLQEGFNVGERQRVALQSKVPTWNEMQLNWTPTPATWSIRHIVEHLVLSSEMVGRPREAASVKNEAWMFRLVPRAWRRAWVLRALNAGIALPLPSPGLEPSGKVPMSELMVRWDAAREVMRRSLDDLSWDATPYSHPVLGPLTGGQMLTLDQTHTAYHTRQIEALQRDPAFPPASMP